MKQTINNFFSSLREKIKDIEWEDVGEDVGVFIKTVVGVTLFLAIVYVVIVLGIDIYRICRKPKITDEFFGLQMSQKYLPSEALEILSRTGKTFTIIDEPAEDSLYLYRIDGNDIYFAGYLWDVTFRFDYQDYLYQVQFWRDYYGPRDSISTLQKQATQFYDDITLNFETKYGSGEKHDYSDGTGRGTYFEGRRKNPYPRRSLLRQRYLHYIHGSWDVGVHNIWDFDIDSTLNNYSEEIHAAAVAIIYRDDYEQRAPTDML